MITEDIYSESDILENLKEFLWARIAQSVKCPATERMNKLLIPNTRSEFILQHKGYKSSVLCTQTLYDRYKG